MQNNDYMHPIVCLSTIDWNFQRQRHQILMSALATSGIPVLYIENPGGRTPSLRDAQRVFLRARNLIQQVFSGTRQMDGVTVLSPIVLPFQTPWAKRLNALLFVRIIAARAKSLGFIRPIFWNYSPTWFALQLAEQLGSVYKVYDCVTNIKGYAYATPDLIASEEAWVRTADIILTDAQSLYDEKVMVNPRTFRIPPGVDYHQFEFRQYISEPEELRIIPKPRLCFFGTLGWWVNYDILKQFARTHPDWTVVLIGPAKVEVSTLNEIPNIVLLSAKVHADLPAYLHVMDVLCIPYLVDAFTDGVFPAKLFESLATGKPVVATPIKELLAYTDTITITEPQYFTKAVETALRDDTLSKQEERKRLARANSWDSRVTHIRHLLEQTMEAK